MKRNPSISPLLLASDRMRCTRLFLTALVLSVLTLPASAQVDVPSETSVQPVLVINMDRLDEETRAGISVQALFEQEIESLSVENERIFAELTKEERQLTQDRATLDAETFRDLADAFDEKVQKIRLDQDEKLRLLQARREEARQDLLRDYNVIILEIVRERGALVLLDRRQVILSADTIDITDEAIGRINAVSPRTDQ